MLWSRCETQVGELLNRACGFDFRQNWLGPLHFVWACKQGSGERIERSPRQLQVRFAADFEAAKAVTRLVHQ